jgi:hypothetical protein
MSKTENKVNWTPIVFVGAAGLALWYLSKPNASGENKIQAAADNLLSSLNPFKGAGWDWSNYGQKTNKDNTTGGDDNTDIDANTNRTTQKTIIPPPEVLQTGAARIAGMGARGYAASALTGKAMPYLWKSGQVARSATATEFRAAGSRVFTKVGTRIETRAAARTATAVAEHAAGRVAISEGAHIAGKLASRAVPIVGWGLAAADTGADVLRFFGLDMPDWLGWSSIPSAFSESGQNIIEGWTH